MLAMFEGVTIGIVLFAVSLLLIYIGIPRKGVVPRFLPFSILRWFYIRLSPSRFWCLVQPSYLGRRFSFHRASSSTISGANLAVLLCASSE